PPALAKRVEHDELPERRPPAASDPRKLTLRIDRQHRARIEQQVGHDKRRPFARTRSRHSQRMAIVFPPDCPPAALAKKHARGVSGVIPLLAKLVRARPARARQAVLAALEPTRNIRTESAFEFFLGHHAFPAHFRPLPGSRLRTRRIPETPSRNPARADRN